MTITYKMFNIVSDDPNLSKEHFITPTSELLTCGCDPDIRDYLKDEWERWASEWHIHYNEPGDPPKLKSFDFRVINTEPNLGVTTFYAYTQEQCYGGPEEGGWYYWMPVDIRTYRVSSKNAARHMARIQRFLDKSYGKRERPVVTKYKPRTNRPHYC